MAFFLQFKEKSISSSLQNFSKKSSIGVWGDT